jgi:hypothetical protein
MDFEGASWLADRLIWRGLKFRLQNAVKDVTHDGTKDDHLVLFKPKSLIDQYVTFWTQHPGYTPQTLFEIGVWFGGSAVIWMEALHLRQLVAIDLLTRSGIRPFDDYMAKAGGRLQVHWGVNQADRPRVRGIVTESFPEGIDMVVDDGAHLYAETLAGFETVFPHLRPGGFYFIEDWAWAHWEEDWGLHGRQPLTRIVSELVEAVGSRKGPVASVTVLPGFVAVERGPGELGPDFRLDHLIYRCPRPYPRAIRPLVRDLWHEATRRLRHRQVRSG